MIIAFPFIRSPAVIQNLRYHIWSFTLTGTADSPIINRIGFFTQGTNDESAPVLYFYKMGLNLNLLDAANICAGFPDLFYKELRVLFFSRLQLEKPAFDLGPCFYLSRIQKNPYPFTPVFLIKGYGKTADIDDFEPSVPYAAGGEKLYCVRETAGGFAYGIKQSVFRKVL
jgi:hypothetical protein